MQRTVKTIENLLRTKVAQAMQAPPELIQRIEVQVKHCMEAPFTSATTRKDETGASDELALIITPTCLGTDPANLYKYLVECMDGQEANPAVDLRRPAQLRAMVRQHLWTDKRLEFVLAHELAHVLNGDLEPKSGLKAMFAKLSFENSNQAREFAADARAAQASPELAIGGVEHLVRQDEFLAFVDAQMEAQGFGEYVQKMKEERHKTHPLFSKRIKEVLNVLEKTHNVPRKEALKRAFGGPDITDPIRLVPENIKRLEAELDLSPDCVDALRSTLHGAPPEGSVKSVIGNMHVKIFSPKGNQKGNKKR